MNLSAFKRILPMYDESISSVAFSVFFFVVFSFRVHTDDITSPFEDDDDGAVGVGVDWLMKTIAKRNCHTDDVCCSCSVNLYLFMWIMTGWLVG